MVKTDLVHDAICFNPVLMHCTVVYSDNSA